MTPIQTPDEILARRISLGLIGKNGSERESIIAKALREYGEAEYRRGYLEGQKFLQEKGFLRGQEGGK